MATEDLRFYDGTSWQSLSALAAEQVDCNLPIESVDATVKVDGNASVFTVSTGGTERVTVTDDAAIFGGQVQTDTITSKDAAANDAEITLGSTVTVSAKLFTPLTLTNDKDGLLIRTINKDGRQYWHGQDLGGWSVCTRQIVNGTAQAVRSFGVTGDYEKPDWRVYSAGFQSDTWVKTPSITGLADNAAEIMLSDQVAITAGDGSEYVPTNSNSIATKKTVDDKIWVGNTAAYNALATKNATTLYCLTD